MSTVQELKESLVEAEENYQRVVELNSHLKKDKVVLMYQLDALREELGELEEELWETKRSFEGQIKLQFEEIQRLSDELKDRKNRCNSEDKEMDHVLGDSFSERSVTSEGKEGRKRSVSTPGARTKRTSRTSGRSRTLRRSRLVNRNQHVVLPDRKKSPPSSVCGRTELHHHSCITDPVHTVVAPPDQVLTEVQRGASPAPRSRLRPPRPACDIILDAAGKLLMTPLNERVNMGCFLMSHLTQNAKSAEEASYPGLIDEPILEPQIESGSSPQLEAHLGHLEPEPEPNPSGGPRAVTRLKKEQLIGEEKMDSVLGQVQKDYIRATWDFGDSWRSRLIFHEFHFAEPAQPRYQGARHKETKLKQSKRRRNTSSRLMVKKLFEKTAEEILAMTISNIEDGRVPASPRLPKPQRQDTWKHKPKRLDSQVPEISGIALRRPELAQKKREAQKMRATVQETSKVVLQVIQEVGQEAREVEGQAAGKTLMPVAREERRRRWLKDRKRPKQHPKCKVS